MATLPCNRGRFASVTSSGSSPATTVWSQPCELRVSLSRLARFAEHWHSSGSDLGLLPSQLNAELCSRRGGRKILGFTILLGPLCQVVINERVNRTVLAKPVLAHECAHLIRGVDGVHLCSCQLCSSDEERAAWYGAALLAVPSSQIHALQAGETRARDIAEECDVPVELVNLRRVLGEYLEAGDSGQNRVPARTERAYSRWIERIGQLAASL